MLDRTDALLKSRRRFATQFDSRRVLEGVPGFVPIGVKRFHWLKASPLHAQNRRLPRRLVRNVENQQVLLRRRTTGAMSLGLRKFKMIRQTFPTEHDPFKAFMVGEARDNIEAEPITIEGDQRSEIIGRARYTKGLCLHFCPSGVKTRTKNW